MGLLDGIQERLKKQSEENKRLELSKKKSEQEELRKLAFETLKSRVLDGDVNTEEEIKFENAKEIAEIWKATAGSSGYKIATWLSGTSTENLTVNYLNALMRQNWIIVRQNEVVIKYLKKLAKEK